MTKRDSHKKATLDAIDQYQGTKPCNWSKNLIMSVRKKLDKISL